MARRRRHGGGLGGNANAAYPTGGTEYNPAIHPPRPHPVPGYIAPPAYTFDPAIEAERRANQRGLEDKEAEIGTTRHFEHTKLGNALRKLHREAARGRQDIGIKQERGLQKIGYERQDTETSASRKQEDFNTQLSNIAKSFKQQGHRQGEAANAAGVLDQGTLAAGGVARQRNQTAAEEPIHVGQRRVAEDLSTALGRLGTAEGEVGADSERAMRRLNQDTGVSKHEAKQETGQHLFLLGRELQQARREGRISDIDKLEQEIYESRSNHPGAFAQWAREHPQAAAMANVPNYPKKKGGGKPGVGGGGPAAPAPHGGGGNKNKKKGKK
jgi:hypothetical protein